MAYKLRRLSDVSGCGPLDVYRAVGLLESQDAVQTPQTFVRRLAAFRDLSAGQPSDWPDCAAKLAAVDAPRLLKSVFEVVFEHVRKEVDPVAPSRLDSLYACIDPLEAFSFTEVIGEARAVFSGSVDSGVPWRVADMAAFRMRPPEDTTASGWKRLMDELRDEAVVYWTNGASPESAEVLVAGSISLGKRVQLLPWLRSAGLVV